MRMALPILALAGLACCAPLPPVPFLPNADVLPPAIEGLQMLSPTRLEVVFDEEIRSATDPLHSDSVPEPELVVHNDTLLLDFPTPPSPEGEHWVETQVSDTARNNLRFAVSFYGLNSDLPAMIINEFTTQGSGSHPDIVEIRVLSEGNLAGACLYEGTPGNWKQRFVFPSTDVRSGDYIVVHFKPEGVPEEINEHHDRTSSGGRDATDGAWDYWLQDGTGLSGNNGVITLCENPMGGVIDAVVYSNRTSDSDERYRGFGSRDVLERVDEVHALGAWRAAGQQIAPEDAINPEPSTSTRSMARGSGAGDTDSSADWHITPTRGLSPGLENTDEVYVP